MKITEYKKLPFIEVSDDTARIKYGNNRWASAAIDILDGDLWGSKISLIGNTIIILCILVSTITYVSTNGQDLELISPKIKHIETLIGILLTIEIALRIRFARYLGYAESRIPAMAYLLSFIGIIDFLSVIPFLIGLTGITLSAGLVSLRILRLWRISRYIPAFRGVSEAFNSRKDEILVTLLAVILLSLTLSAVMYHAEIAVGSNSFKDIMEVFIWSLGKYTGDYGAIADAAPLSSMGKFIATCNGLLGIALFAIPAGLLASAFIDQLADQRKAKEIKERFNVIANYFDKSTGGGKHFKFTAKSRFFSFDSLQAKFIFSDEQLFEAIRESPRLRFRAMKSSPEILYNDIRIVECFKINCSYGHKSTKAQSRMLVVNPVGEVERGISHFARTIGDSLDVNLVSREIALTQGEAKVGSNKSKFYPLYLTEGPDRFSLPYAEFMGDIAKAKSSDIIIIVSSAASGRSDMVIEYGNSVGDKFWNKERTTIKEPQRFEQIKNSIISNLSNINYRTQSEKNIERSFTLEESTIGLNGEDSLIKTVQKMTGADVIALHVNISILIGPDEIYYPMLTAVCDILSEIKSLYEMD